MEKKDPTPYGVMIFLMLKDRFLLTLRDNKPGIISPNTWCPVCGQVDDHNDSYLETAIRELREEICVVPKEIIPIGRTRRHNAIFFGRLTDEESSQVTLGNEGQDIGFYSYEEIFALDLAQAFKDHLGNAPEIFRKISQEGYVPTQKDLFLQPFNDFPPTPEV